MTTTNEFFNRLEGVWKNKVNTEWQDHLGWNFISQPELGMEGEGDFVMRFDQMRETITFKQLPGTARNVGIKGEAGHWAAMAYEVAIETPSGDGIHHEMGHFLMNVQADGTTKEDLKAPIIRQATIPRANAMMTTGTLKPGRINPGKDIYGAKPVTTAPALQIAIDEEFANKRKEVIRLRGPDLEKPLTWLKDQIAARPRTNSFRDWVFEFRDDKDPSQMASGQRVENPVGIGNLLSDFWIGAREIDGSLIVTLQYAQKVNLKFNGIDWPHLAVNTLVHQPE